jgi:hypothetical protein
MEGNFSGMKLRLVSPKNYGVKSLKTGMKLRDVKREARNSKPTV